MNILFCYNKPIGRKFGGVAAVSYTLMEGLNSRGHNCYGISATRANEEALKNQFYLPEETIDSDNQVNKKWFGHFLIEKEIDVLINQNALEPSSEWPLRWSQGFNLITLTVYHNSLFSMFSWNDERINNYPILGYLQVSKILNWLIRNAFRLKYGSKYKRSIQLSYKIVMLSKYYFQELAWFSGIAPDSRFVSIPNPAQKRFDIDINTIKKEKEILFVGRLDGQKRVDLLLRIWGIISPKYRDWKLIIVGDGRLRSDLEEMVINEKIQHVYFEGYQDPLKYYRRASIFCLTSKFEGFPGVLVEAMGCGCVPVSFNSYACVLDIIENGESGFIIPSFNLELYAKSLMELMSDPELLLRFSLKAKEKSKDFTLDNVLRKWENLFCLNQDS